MKDISARVIFREHPELKEWFPGKKFWKKKFSVQEVGEKVVVEVVRQYITYHLEQEKFLEQLKFFKIFRFGKGDFPLSSNNTLIID